MFVIMFGCVRKKVVRVKKKKKSALKSCIVAKRAECESQGERENK